jgi:hypothetical protein
MREDKTKLRMEEGSMVATIFGISVLKLIGTTTRLYFTNNTVRVSNLRLIGRYICHQPPK